MEVIFMTRAEILDNQMKAVNWTRVYHEEVAKEHIQRMKIISKNRGELFEINRK